MLDTLQPLGKRLISFIVSLWQALLMSAGLGRLGKIASLFPAADFAAARYPESLQFAPKVVL